MKNIIIALDDGHGMGTPGKRTPYLPGTKEFMHENEFNRSVVQRLEVNLNRCKFHTVVTAPGDQDTELYLRVQRAENAKADLFLSIHANALNGVFGEQQGVSTHYYPNSVPGKFYASVIQRYLLEGTQQKNRGIIASDFYVLRESRMPAVLVEAAFMDNLREANLLMSADFRQEVADETCRALCEIFDYPYYASIQEITYKEAIKAIAQFSGIDPDYWVSRQTIDRNFEGFVKKIAKAINNKG